MSTNTIRSALLFSRQKHPFHILPPSPLPILTSTFLMVWLFLQVLYFQNIRLECFGGYLSLLHAAIIGLFVTLGYWFIDIILEAADGEHTAKVQRGLRLGFILFIVSEVMLFFAVFWGFFHFSLVPSIAIGAVWPPLGTQVINVWYLPFINTNLLLMSGFAVTLAHMDLLSDDQDGFFDHLTATIIFGLTFLWVQGLEYKYGVKFSWRGNIYGSIFFMSTGFHGLHVTVGILFLFVCWLRVYAATPAFQNPKLRDTHQYYPIGFTRLHHFGFEAAAWYWHFVDVVWLFLFITVYWWGGSVSSVD